jgi:hypothetical protein
MPDVAFLLTCGYERGEGACQQADQVFSHHIQIHFIIPAFQLLFSEQDSSGGPAIHQHGFLPDSTSTSVAA